MTLTEMANICDICVHSPAFCGGEPEICVTKYAQLYPEQLSKGGKPMNKQDKPRICEVLGVEVGERFDFCDVRGEYYNNVRVDSDGKIRFSEGMGDYLLSAGNVCYLINHPESIVRRKRFTEQEVEDAKNIRRIYSADKVYRSAEGKLAISLSKASLIAVINPDLFPSIAPGESYTLDGIIGRCE